MARAPAVPVTRTRTRAQRFSGALLARIGLSLRGRWTYVFGGGMNGRLQGDCSLFVSYVLHRAGLAIPGGRWGAPGQPPVSHGPVVTDYAAWSGATTVGTPQAGDLCIWDGAGAAGHIGIAISPDQMVSALNPSLGVRVTPIQGTGPSGSPLIYRRLNGVAGGGVIGPAPGQQAPAHPPAVVLVLVAGLYAGAAVLAGGLLLAAGYGVTRAAGRLGS